jgi:cytochrome c oxidase assembly factor CtaG
MEWNWDPLILSMLVITAILYARGLFQQRERQGGLLYPHQKWRAVAFGAGMGILFLALISPVDTYSDQLFSVHMAQHILFMDISAPLLAYSAPLGPILQAFPRRYQRAAGQWWSRPGNWIKGLWQWVSYPATAWVLFVGFLWLWHIPAFYSAAIENETIHALEHLCFLGSGFLFWWNIFYVFWRKPKQRGTGVVYMGLYALQSSGLGGLLTFSTATWYPVYISTSEKLGVSPLADQQIAGMIMWLPEMAIYIVGALIMLKGWLESMENDEENQAYDALEPKGVRNPVNAGGREGKVG